ncbi:MAG: sigma-70 family RNA polymerase sigma factor [Mariprofundaceae bacterium]|nr:sigma-70 family RNA polymerase sigma factor [Mariprofundaceae bacterium]
MITVIQAWKQHESELRSWLRSRLNHVDDAHDVLQQVFEKALLQGDRFCSVENVRAWLFQVARNILIDRYRMQHHELPLPDDVVADVPTVDMVDELSECLPRVLSELAADDRAIIVPCDLNGVSQQAYADAQGLTLSAVKSRIQRARKRLRDTLKKNCQVRTDESGKVCCFVPRPPLG